jgi:phosphoglycerate kinase
VVDGFAVATEALAGTLAKIEKTDTTTIIGGGDSVAAVEKVGFAEEMRSPVAQYC